MPPRIHAENLFKIFGGTPQEALAMYHDGITKKEILKKTGNVIAVADVSFSVEEGETFMVMGLSGSGKSTLVRLVNRLLYPTSGHIFIDGEDLATVNEDRVRKIRREKLAMVFQNFGLFPHKSVQENAEYGLKVSKVEPEKRHRQALKALELVGLHGWTNRSITDLSGGMQQRVGLARALATDPEVLLMDEAFSALDPLIRREMQDELLKLQQTMHKTILFITHDLHEALKLGDRIAVMKDGAIVQIGTPEEIVASPANEYVKAFTLDVNRGLVFNITSMMERTDALTLGRDSVRMATFRMHYLDRDILYVKNQDDKPAGLVSDQEIATARQGHILNLEKIMRTDFPQIQQSEKLSAALPLCIAGVPIAVIDEQERLVGQLNPIDVLALMSPEEPTNGDNTVEPVTRKVSEETI